MHINFKHVPCSECTLVDMHLVRGSIVHLNNIIGFQCSRKVLNFVIRLHNVEKTNNSVMCNNLN